MPWIILGLAEAKNTMNIAGTSICLEFETVYLFSVIEFIWTPAEFLKEQKAHKMKQNKPYKVLKIIPSNYLWTFLLIAVSPPKCWRLGSEWLNYWPRKGGKNRRRAADNGDETPSKLCSYQRGLECFTSITWVFAIKPKQPSALGPDVPLCVRRFTAGEEHTFKKCWYG